MKKLKLMAKACICFIVSAFALSCTSNSDKIITVSDVKPVYDVNGVNFKMIEIPGVTFGMGQRPDGRIVIGANGLHQVILDGYAISEYPVSQALWKAVMGSNPSSVQGDNYPVDRVSYEDCQKFVKKLSKLTNTPFYIPTEAQWEYAVTHNDIKFINNTKEWCRDSYSDEKVDTVSINPLIRLKSDDIVIRTNNERLPFAKYKKANGVTLRLALYTNKKCDEDIINAIIKETPKRENTCKNEVINANGVKIDMIAVKGGEFSMGATPEQGKYAEDDEKPVKNVKVDNFEISKYEVTNALWKAVMGSLPYGNDENKPNMPVFNVSWYKAQEFILALNKLTGRSFRLPTEAEWEYAARGGNKSGGYIFAGSNQLSAVGAYTTNSNSKVQNVGKYQKNELGIYDMSGNVWEWCQDRYGSYDGGKKIHQYVMRGGSASSRWEMCRVANRSKIPGGNIKSTFGLRLCL